MKKTIKIIVFKLGVDVLGFPNFHMHYLLFWQKDKIYRTLLHKKLELEKLVKDLLPKNSLKVSGKINGFL